MRRLRGLLSRGAVVLTAVIGVVTVGSITVGVAEASAIDYCAVKVTPDGVKWNRCSQDAALVRAWAAPAGYDIVMTAYPYGNYTGPWLMVTFSKARCTASTSDRDVVVDSFDLGSPTFWHWDNAIGSVKTDLTGDTRCSVHFFDRPGRAGSSLWVHHQHADLHNLSWSPSSFVIS